MLPSMITHWRAALRRSLEIQITLAGFLYSVAMGVVGATAVLSANNLLFLILAAMLALLLISGFLSRLSLSGLEIDFAAPEHITARRTFRATLALRNSKGWFPSFSIRVEGAADPGSDHPSILRRAVYLPVVPGGRTVAEQVEIEFPRRGAYRQRGFRLATRFPFGFREKTAQVELTREVLVYPSIDAQPGFEELIAAIRGELEGLHAGPGQDFYRIRPYQASESARYVDWKTSAHTGELQVREFAREEDRQAEIFLDRMVAPDSAGEAWLEKAIDLAAYLTWSLAERGLTFEFRSQGFSRRVPGEADVYTILRFLALATRLPEASPDPPHGENAFQVVISTRPAAFEAAGWTPVVVLDRAALLLEPRGANPSGR